MLSDGVCVIEWAEKAMEVFPPEHLHIQITAIGADSRRLRLTPHGDRYLRLVAQVRTLAATP